MSMSISCIGDEALLQVKLSLTPDEIFTKSRSPLWTTYWEWEDEEDDSETGWEDEDEEEDVRELYPFARHRQGDKIEIKKFTPKDLTDYEACVPRDECSQIVVAGLPTYGYELMFDGEAFDTGYEFYFDAVNPMTYTNVGNCPTPTIPVCNDDEALFELQHLSRARADHKSTFSVKDQDGNSVLDGSFEEPFRLDKVYTCLPKDEACYTFLIAIREQREPTGDAEAQSYSIFFDGELLRSSDTWQIDSVRFGSCEPSCNEDESVIEFFMYHEKYPDDEFEFKWNLSSPSASISGVVPHGPGISFLAHETMCVPKGSCSSFSIEGPDNMTQVVEQEIIPEGTLYWSDLDWDSLETEEVIAPINVEPVYTLKMDNVFYRKAKFDTAFPAKLTTNMGACTVSNLCDVQTEDLFHFEYHVPANAMRTFEDFPPIPLQLRDKSPEEWHFGYIYHVDFGEKKRSLFNDNAYMNNAYDLNSTLKVFECVPKDGCDLSFNESGGFTPEEYTVKKNGMQVTDGGYIGVIFPSFVMPFGQDCPFSFSSSNALTLSGGAIASVVVAVISGLIWY